MNGDGTVNLFSCDVFVFTGVSYSVLQWSQKAFNCAPDDVKWLCFSSKQTYDFVSNIYNWDPPLILYDCVHHHINITNRNT